ncbi:hypothetical protein Btru_050772 [Bulinus truncatus]|nr:hypothetical protein Btru_050772 [Bulinus truncatus]
MADADTIRRLWRYKSDLEDSPDEEKMLEILGKLKHLHVTIAALQETGVGKLVNTLRKYEGVVGKKALEVVTVWKSYVENEVDRLENSKKNVRTNSPVNNDRDSDADSWNSYEDGAGDDAKSKNRSNRGSSKQNHTSSRRQDNKSHNEDKHSSKVYIPTPKNVSSGSHSQEETKRRISDANSEYTPSTKDKYAPCGSQQDYIPTKKANGMIGAKPAVNSTSTRTHNLDDDLTDSDIDMADASAEPDESKSSAIEEYYQTLLDQRKDSDCDGAKRQYKSHGHNDKSSSYKDSSRHSSQRSSHPEQGKAHKGRDSVSVSNERDNKIVDRKRKNHYISDSDQMDSDIDKRKKTNSHDVAQRKKSSSQYKLSTVISSTQRSSPSHKSSSEHKSSSHSSSSHKSSNVKPSSNHKEHSSSSHKSSTDHKSSSHGTYSRHKSSDDKSSLDRPLEHKSSSHGSSSNHQSPKERSSSLDKSSHHKSSSQKSSSHRSTGEKSSQHKSSSGHRSAKASSSHKTPSHGSPGKHKSSSNKSSVSSMSSDTKSPTRQKSSSASQVHDPLSAHSPLNSAIDPDSLSESDFESDRPSSCSSKKHHNFKSTPPVTNSESGHLGSRDKKSLNYSSSRGASNSPHSESGHSNSSYIPSKKPRFEDADASLKVTVSLQEEAQELYSPTQPLIRANFYKGTKSDKQISYSPTPVINSIRVKTERHSPSPLGQDLRVRERLHSPTPSSHEATVKREKYSPSRGTHERELKSKRRSPTSVKKTVKEDIYSPSLVADKVKVKEERYSPTPVVNKIKVKEERYSPIPVSKTVKVKEERYSPTPLGSQVKEKDKYSSTSKVKVKEERYSPVLVGGSLNTPTYSPTPLSVKSLSCSRQMSESEDDFEDRPASADSPDQERWYDSDHSEASEKDSKKDEKASSSKHKTLRSDHTSSSAKDQHSHHSKDHRHQTSSTKGSHSSKSDHKSKRPKPDSSTTEHKNHKPDSSSADFKRKKADSSSDEHKSKRSETSSVERISSKPDSSGDKQKIPSKGSSRDKHGSSSDSKHSKSVHKTEASAKTHSGREVETHKSYNHSSKHRKEKSKLTEGDVDLFSDVIQIKTEQVLQKDERKLTKSSGNASLESGKPSKSVDSNKSDLHETPSTSQHGLASKRKPVIDSDDDSGEMLPPSSPETDEEDGSVKKGKKSVKAYVDQSGMSFDDFLNYDKAAAVKKSKSGSKSSKVTSSSATKVSASSSSKVTSLSAAKVSSASSSSKAKSNQPQPFEADKAHPSTSKSTLSLPVPTKNFVVTEQDLLSLLPETHAQYKPLRYNPYYMNDAYEEKARSPSPPRFDPDSVGVKSLARTQVYSGRKHGITEVKPLYDLCMQVLIENIDLIDNVGGVPYSILKPVLERCTAPQLYQLEDFNPHFLEDTNELWKNLCIRDFRGSKPDELESWRELYLRKFEEREVKYQKLKESMSSMITKGQAGRKAQLAYVDTVAKPPREVLRKQKQFGTGSIKLYKGGNNAVKSYKASLTVPAYNPMAENPSMMKPTPPMMARALQMRKNMMRR